MNTSGGFLLEPSEADAGPSRATLGVVGDDEEGSVTARKLSAKQEVRLMNYLDEEFLQINRGFNKRHNSKSSSVPRLDSFLQAYEAILEVIASIPPIGPSASLLVSYLLRLTSELLDGIAGYDTITSTTQVTHGDEDGQDEEDEVSRDMPLLSEQLQRVIQCLSLLDKVWSCVLRGQLIDIKAAKSNVQQDFTDSDDYFPASKEGDGSHGAGEERQQSKARVEPAAVPGRYPSRLNRGYHLREARSIVGSKGFASVAQTDRIRLRNVLTLAKENLFAWMRIQLNVPLPPPQIGLEEVEERDVEVIREAIDKGAVGVVDMGEAEGEEDLEEVDTDRKGEGAGEEDMTREQDGDSHYNDLFARKIDPDASDSDSGSHTNEGVADEEPALKRMKRNDRSESRQASLAPSNDVESVATFSNTATVMKWDIKFARLFANTLRCLSDIQEYRNQRDATSQKTTTDKEGE